MATTITPATLKARAPAFATVRNVTLQVYIDEAVRWVDDVAWGPSHYDDGVFYFACHVLTENAMLNLEGMTPAGSAGSVPAGPITQERILTWSASYATAGAFEDDALSTTAWGRRFIARRDLVFSPRSL